ncbi:TetR family transcriptional regulator [Vulcanimicrobium alpinum]|uniref:TetR family transcriptional regulator n=1 Tax=Vulcanimicrobium alpinum TaxID=3016050 RepID=A0AAN1XZ64_UNVUL|nr:TetR/AcrR family transcriptional regulator [Vulcanimicrobium alpinum]BDE08073.1 TetR family transcriptional regulator [Vulcanimicrobium alpinum]
MGIAERKERQRAELREQILAAARKIVLDEGYEQLTMRKIADAIEYSPAAIYLYFENREAIGRQLCAESFEHLIAYMAPVSAIADPFERLLSMGRCYARFGLENPREYRLLFMTDAAYMQALFPPDHQKDDHPGERAFQFVVDIVTSARDAGAIEAADPIAVAEMLWTAVHGIVSLALTCSEAIETPLETLVETMCATIGRGLATPAARAAHVVPAR